MMNGIPTDLLRGGGNSIYSVYDDGGVYAWDRGSLAGYMSVRYTASAMASDSAKSSAKSWVRLNR